MIARNNEPNLGRPSQKSTGEDHGSARYGEAGIKLGQVYLVGAGPGDPGLFTLRGAELLQRAEVVVYDGLVNRELLRLAPPTAEICFAGKHDRCRAVSQDEINALLLDRARKGRMVVRLKGGDPFLFGRGGEEAEILAAAGVPFAVVPGVSSIQAVPAYAGIPLTHRAHASSVTVVTGHEAPGTTGDKQDWAALAGCPGTLVVLMGLKHLAAITEVLLAHGRAPGTAVAVISRGTTSGQKTMVGTLSTIASQVAQAGLLPPAVTVIGEVVQCREQLNTYEKLPLFGKRIIVTQRHDLAVPLIGMLRELGAEVCEITASQFRPPREPEPLNTALVNLALYDWILFSSPHTVEIFLDRVVERYGDLRALGNIMLGAYGPLTASSLRERLLQPAAIAADHKTPLILDALKATGRIHNRRFLVLRGEWAQEHVPEALTTLGARVDVAACFGLEPDLNDPVGAAASVKEEGADWIVFASGLAIEHFHRRFDLTALKLRFPHLQFALASPTIQWALDQLGLPSAAIARANDPENLADEIVRAETRASESVLRNLHQLSVLER
jgi:uroporphyrinogen III methyltransferase / synthase